MPYCYYPDAVGGTEIYVSALVRELSSLGHENVIAAPGRTEESYIHEDIKVVRFQTSGKISLDRLYGEGDAQVADQFKRMLENEKPDVVHLHAFTSGSSVQWARIVKAMGVPLVLTYHTPTVSCQRGTMMRWGAIVCNGKMELAKCCPCVLEGKGVSSKQAIMLTYLSIIFGPLVAALRLEGGLWTALRIRELIREKFTVTRELFNLCDHIIATARWVREVLILNETSPEKITVLKQGLCFSESKDGLDFRVRENSDSIINGFFGTNNQEVKLVFLGRFDQTKGLHVLIDALAAMPTLSLELHVFGIEQGCKRSHYLERILKRVEGDKRIIFLPVLSHSEVFETLKKYDALLVPSQWMETGPMVVLEAFAAGIPVIGSDLGGIQDIVRHDVDGLLVPFDNKKKWSDVLERIVKDKTLLPRLKRNIASQKTMQTVTKHMESIYKKLHLNSN